MLSRPPSRALHQPLARWQEVKRHACLAAAVVAVGALVLTGCSSNSDSTTPSAGNNPEGLTNGKPITVWSPDATSLVPTNSNEEGGLKVLDTLYTGLITYNPQTSEPENAVAESITPDATKKVYTIVLKKGWKFHDGTEVKAHNFVDAWNYGANGNNAQINQGFYTPIEGFAAVAGETDAEGKLITKPTTDKLSGLKVVDDYTFTVTLTQPLVNFDMRLGVMAFMPEPDSFFANHKAAEEKPVGNGPYQFVAWDKGKSLDVKRFDGYIGADKGGVDAIRFVQYTQASAAYTDLLDGKLDVMEGIPSAALQADKYKKDLGSHFYNSTDLSLTTLSFPQSVPALKNPNLAKAVSLAIDRPTVNSKLMNGTRPPADGWVPPGTRGYLPGQCGDLCTFDPARAKEYLAKANFTGTVFISYPKDAGQDELITAICDSIKNTIGVKCELMPSPDFKSYMAAVQSNKNALVRLTYQADYPSIDNFIVELYSNRGGSNLAFYDSKPFEDLINKASSAATQEQFYAGMQEAERYLQTDMPAVPLYTVQAVVGYSQRVTSLRTSKVGNVDWSSVKLA
jgi:oligopeptide transport system substrate-binding protein